MGLAQQMHSPLAAVVIGRNEGERLRLCLASLHDRVGAVVYVDSGSTDGSVELALQFTQHIVKLDPNIPFTAARARNEGFRLLADVAEFDFVQFVDGDCEVVPTWFEPALSSLSGDDDVAVVCGRRRERFPQATVYNGLIDQEWDTPIGEAKACGGDAIMRKDVFVQVGGFNEKMIAGEEPELCVRIRKLGYKVLRLDLEMTRHDAALVSFWQWWRRNRRAGHAYAEGAYIHGKAPERHNVRQTLRAIVWGLFLPMCILLAGLISPWIWAGFLIFPIQVARLAGRSGSWTSSMFLTLGKVPEALGILDFVWRRFVTRKIELIEYK